MTPVEPLKPRLWDNFEMYSSFNRKQQQIGIHMLLAISYSEPVHLITPIELL